MRDVIGCILGAAVGAAIAIALAAGLARGDARADSTVRVDVLFTSDLHGGIGRSSATFLNPEFPPPLGGGASAAAYVARVRASAKADGRRVLLFDSGDFFQGTPVGTHTRGSEMVAWMNRMGYDAMTFGNHDFDLGRDNAARLAGLAEFPVLIANLYDRETGARVAWARDHVMLEADGIRIGVLGYITESTIYMAFERNIAGLEFRPVYAQLEDDVRRVRAAGADLVFVLLHQGLPYRLDVETAYRDMRAREAEGGLERPGMDAIFAGHTHQGYDHPWEDPRTHTLVFEPFGNGSSLGHVTFDVDRATRTLIGYETHFDRGALLTLLADDVWPDTSEVRLIGGAVAEAEKDLDVEVGRALVRLARGAADDALMGFVVADAMRAVTGADFALQNTGGVRADLEAGPITARDILAVSPFGNQMVIARLRGDLLRDLLEAKVAGRGGGMFISGGRVRYDLDRPDGDRIVEFTIGGAAVDSARIYSVALTDYLAEGNSGLGRLRDLPPETFLPAGMTDREALTRYIREQHDLKATNDGRWTRIRR